MINKIIAILKHEGIIKLFILVVRRGLYIPSRRIYNIALDRHYKIDTEEEASLSSLGFPEDTGERYQPTPINVFLAILRHFNISSSDVFLDIGSGKGRTMLLAGRYPFNRIIGVEVSEKLNRIAECNVKNMKQRLVCKNYEFVTSNALEYEIPATVTYIYLFNPFTYKVLQKVLLNIKDSIRQNPRNVILMYYNPKFAAEMEREHKLIKINDLEFDHWLLIGSGRLYKFNCYIYRFPFP